MAASAIRQWLGLYVLILTSAVGAYLLIAPPILLPLPAPDKVASTEIIVPFLIAQVAAVYRFYSSATTVAHEPRLPIPSPLVKAPLIIVSLVLIIEFAFMAAGGIAQATWTPSAESFKALLTFCVSILNASTVFVITRYFQAGASGQGAAATAAPSTIQT